MIFFNEKKIEKDSDNFWYRKLTLKVGRLGDFALFDTSPLVQFSKFKKILWVCWFVGKNLSNFMYPVWKLHNPYCHTLHHIGPSLLRFPKLGGPANTSPTSLIDWLLFFSILANVTPFRIGVFSDNIANVALDGFDLTYRQTPCN